MRDVSYEILDLLKKYNGNLKAVLMENHKPEYLYALSEIRENLLEWFEFKKEGTLLQVGSDYGALTGLLSSKVSHVDVLEQKDENLAVNNVRNGGNENISFLKGNLSCYEPEEPYDYVVMVGCPEAASPDMVERAKACLKQGGILLAAVSNQYGLRYWAGAVRDEEEPFLTLSQATELYSEGTFYFPMPDYRLPVTVYSENYLPKKGDLANLSTAYDYPRYELFDEGKMFDALCEDSQFEHFANSFLIIWENTK